MNVQTTNTVLMVRPKYFGFNEETAQNNFFQQHSGNHEQLRKLAMTEFDSMVDTLRSNHISVLVFEQSEDDYSPDAIFPNNWISTTPTGVITIFPLWARSRRSEKSESIIQTIQKNFEVHSILDLSECEAENFFLEGTGSMVIDHQNQFIFAALSPRTHKSALAKFAAFHGYRAITFNSSDRNDNIIYHTNVMMSVATNYAIICLDSIHDEMERIAIDQLLRTGGRNVIEITRDQMHSFAGNVIELHDSHHNRHLILSETALASLSRQQLKTITATANLVPVSIPTVEKIGGGGARCMIAEIFLKPLRD